MAGAPRAFVLLFGLQGVFGVWEASQFYFDGLTHAVRFDLERSDGREEVLAAVEELFFAASYFHARVHDSFR
jgi:hypothetical protein